MRLVLVAEEAAGLRVFDAILSSSHELVALLVTPPAAGERGSALWEAAAQRGQRVWPPHLVTDPGFGGTLREHRVDALLNVHSLRVVDAGALQAPRFGCFNLHPGPLPEYAGLNTVSWAISRGETRYGVTLHTMTPRIDAGAIVYQSGFEITEKDNALAVYSKCLKHGVALVSRLLEELSEDPGAIPRIPQDAARRRYYRRGPPGDGRVAWSGRARDIFNLVRACNYFPFPSPWEFPRSWYRGEEFRLAAVDLTGRSCDDRPGTVVEITDGGALIACGDELLGVTRIVQHGKRVASSSVFRDGDHVGDVTPPVIL